jgi:hypothetical protein
LNIILLALLGAIFHSSAFGWFAEGHEIVAVIAADNLTPVAKARTAKILGVPTDTGSIAKGMAAASIRADTEFRADKATHRWHYIGLCLQDGKRDLAVRCPHGNCVTAKINEYANRLRNKNYDKWGAAGDLAFLVHFVGDIHQPLHAATNADRGGTCQAVDVVPAEANLHYAWDDAVVVQLERRLGTDNPGATARKLEKLYPLDATSSKWKPDTSEQIAWESHQLAETEVYRALGIPEKQCILKSCDSSTSTPIELSPAYMGRAAQVAGRQLGKAGYRLAELLNHIWP